MAADRSAAQAFRKGRFLYRPNAYLQRMDIFDGRLAKPMPAGPDREAFDDPDYLYELKLDGERCLAYLDPRVGETVLVSKQGRLLSAYLPELADLHTRVSSRLILDGELVIGTGQRCAYELIRSRLRNSRPSLLPHQAKAHPATLVAFDILYREGQITGLPLAERKEILEQSVIEDDRLAVSRAIRGKGVHFFSLVREQNLEGVVAKRADSPYRMGKQNRDWAVFRNWDADDFVIVGWWPSDPHKRVVSVVLGQFSQGELIYKGYVVLDEDSIDFARIRELPTRTEPTVFWGPKSERHHKTIWLEPLLTARIRYVCLTANGRLRKPRFQRIQADVRPEQCVVQEERSPDA